MSNGIGCSKQHTVISAATGCEGVPDENPATNSSGDHKTAIAADLPSGLRIASIGLRGEKLPPRMPASEIDRSEPSRE